MARENETDLRKPSSPITCYPSHNVRHCLVVDEILAEARNGGYDLVVVGAHPVGGPHSFLLDNIAHQVMKRINRPILVVKEKEAPDPAQ